MVARRWAVHRRYQALAFLVPIVLFSVFFFSIVFGFAGRAHATSAPTATQAWMPDVATRVSELRERTEQAAAQARARRTTHGPLVDVRPLVAAAAKSAPAPQEFQNQASAR